MRRPCGRLASRLARSRSWGWRAAPMRTSWRSRAVAGPGAAAGSRVHAPRTGPPGEVQARQGARRCQGPRRRRRGHRPSVAVRRAPSTEATRDRGHRNLGAATFPERRERERSGRTEAQRAPRSVEGDLADRSHAMAVQERRESVTVEVRAELSRLGVRDPREPVRAPGLDDHREVTGELLARASARHMPRRTGTRSIRTGSPTAPDGSSRWTGYGRLSPRSTCRPRPSSRRARPSAN